MNTRYVETTKRCDFCNRIGQSDIDHWNKVTFVNIPHVDAQEELPAGFYTYNCCLFCYAILKRFLRRSALDYMENESTLGNHCMNLTVYGV